MKFTGKNVLVTGSSRGIGAEVAKVLAGYGLKVWINYRSGAAAADAVKAEIEAVGGQAAVIGFQIGRMVPELATPSDARIGVTELFTRFYEIRENSLRLKDFGSRDLMRSQLFPDQTYRTDLTYDWSL